MFDSFEAYSKRKSDLILQGKNSLLGSLTQRGKADTMFKTAASD